MAHPRDIVNRLLSVGIAAALVLSGLCAPATAAPGSLSKVRSQAHAARVRLDALSDDLEVRGEEYLAAREQLDRTRLQVSLAQDALVQAEGEVAAADQRFEDRVNSIYRHGTINLLSVFLGVDDFKDLVTRLDMLRRVESSDAELVRVLDEARAKVAGDRRRLEIRRNEQMALVKTASARQSAVSQALSEQKRYLGQLDARLKKMVAQERARQERLARQRAARAAAAAKSIGTSSRAAGQLGASHPGALALAETFVGKVDYVWGGTTPSGFDCSGLTQYCYRAIGIDIPRTSRAQYRFGSFIPADRLDLLAPGDLVFFGRGGNPSRVHHVGIYAGGGLFVHAPQTGMKVMVSSLYGRIATRGDYVGATRP